MGQEKAAKELNARGKQTGTRASSDTQVAVHCCTEEGNITHIATMQLCDVLHCHSKCDAKQL